jgi:hypothetical protein
MISKVVLQKQVVELSSKLPAVTKKQIQWGYDKCLSRYVVLCRKTLYCLECGYGWKDDPSVQPVIKDCICQSCKAKLIVKHVYSKNYEETEYYAIVTVVGDFQVVRMLCLKKFMKKGVKAQLDYSEVMQHWIASNGTITTLQKQVRGFSYYFDLWIFNSELKIRSNSDRSKQRQLLNPLKIYPYKKILPILRRNGFKGHFYGCVPHVMFSRLLNVPLYETLLKAKQIELVKKYIDEVHHIVQHWRSIKICIRNGYIINDPSMYFDYLDLLTHFQKDLRSPKYLCPDDLMRAHDRFVNKKRAVEREANLKKQLKKIKKHQAIYEKQKQQFFGLQFQDKELVVKVIESVKDFFEEGDYHRHCVYINEYYTKQDSLVFSAKINGIPVETVEVSLSQLKIKQARGRGNKSTKHHKKILELVNKNMHQIRSKLKSNAMSE